jgi:hypothetical protein
MKDVETLSSDGEAEMKMDIENDVLCSFCSKSYKEVRKVIAGPAVFICDECIGRCLDILTEDGIDIISERAGSRIEK